MSAELTKYDWVVLSHQLDALRAFWGLHVTAPDERRSVCGASWIADYGPLPCDKAQGHDGPHRCYGSQGPIEFGVPVASPLGDRPGGGGSGEQR